MVKNVASSIKTNGINILKLITGVLVGKRPKRLIIFTPNHPQQTQGIKTTAPNTQKKITASYHIVNSIMGLINGNLSPYLANI